MDNVRRKSRNDIVGGVVRRLCRREVRPQTLGPTCIESLMTRPACVSRHMEAFAEAIAADDLLDNDSLETLDSPVLAPRPGPSRTPSIHSQLGRIRKVSAVSDFAPVHVKVKKRRKPSLSSTTLGKRQEWLFLLVRWPLLVSFGLYPCLLQADSLILADS